jgi:two-component system, OmpR family, sensor histidine kinase KdpD
MSPPPPASPPPWLTLPPAVRRAAPAALAWAVGWVAMVVLDGRVDLANLAMVLVLSSAIAALWLGAVAAALAGTVAVLGFNWAFVPPRGTFTVELHQHAVLLGAMLAVNAIIAALIAAQRRQAACATLAAARADQLRQWGDLLRGADDPVVHAGALQAALADAAAVPVCVIVTAAPPSSAADDTAAHQAGDCDDDQRAGLWHCLRQGRPMGPGTGLHDELPDAYLPLRGRDAAYGAAVLRGVGPLDARGGLRAHAQALCDQMGVALQRAAVAAQARQARDEAQAQGVRNALLAAISHDYRTPLAAIMSAASSLDTQGERLDATQRRRLARSIVEETALLGRLTDNTLQLARLDAPGVSLRCDWEAAEELVGTALRHARRRRGGGDGSVDGIVDGSGDGDGHRVRARLEPGLPLLWCDALLIQQLLDNLVDNALKMSPAGTPVEILVRRQGTSVVLAVRDRGPGVAPAWRDRIFQPFHRGAEPARPDVSAQLDTTVRPGAGVGLAVCRAIARAHGGELRLRARGHGGSSFECHLPLREPPAAEVEPRR